MVSFSKRAGVEDKLITANAESFMHDIAKFFWEQSGSDTPFEESDSLKNWKGIDPSSPSFEDLCDGIRAVADTLGKLGEFGTVIKYKSADDLLAAVKAQYIQKMELAASSAKFDKASTPIAQAAAEKLKAFVTEYVDKVKKLL